MTYSKKDLPAGLGKIEREYLSTLLRETNLTVSVSEAASILKIERKQAAKILSWYASKGWLKRIYHGVYLPVPITSPTSDIVATEPFAIAEKLFTPCYIGGMNATNYWGLTEQIFITITVMTNKKVRHNTITIADTEYNLHTIKSLYFFGLKSIWLDGVKVQISDPTRTIVDMMMFPDLCGGLRFIIDVLQNYYTSKYKDIDLLIDYLSKIKNRAAIKRLGFLVEKFFPEEKTLINYCLNNLTQGYTKIAPNIECPRLLRRWRLWLPEYLKEE